MTAANRVAQLHLPELEMFEPRATRKQESPQIICLWRWLRVWLSRKLGLLSQLGLFFLEIGLVVWAGHGLLNAKRR